MSNKVWAQQSSAAVPGDLDQSLQRLDQVFDGLGSQSVRIGTQTPEQMPITL
jgi:hypothetical protein